MAKIRLTVSLDVDLGELGREYGETFTQKQAREHISHDLREALGAVPYRDALKAVEVK